jgi:hypothetical protein
MSIQKVKRWQWVLIGLLAGAGICLVRLTVGGLNSTPVGMGQAEFEHLLAAPPALGKYAALEEINIIPVDAAYWVRAQRRYPAADGSGFEYRTEWLALRERQYRPINASLSANATMNRAEFTVRDFLADAAARDPHIHYRYAWERDARFALPVWALGGALLIGGVWPWALGVMYGAGLGPEGRAYDLSRFAPEVAVAHAGAELSATERDRLVALEAEMEDRLRIADGSGAEQPPMQATSDLPTTPQLSGEPLEAQPHPVAQEKQFGGEFYPTETHPKEKSS